MTTAPARAPRHEATAFFDVLQSTPPDAVTACRDWTAHDIVAHLASGAEGLANQIEAHFDGRPIPAFGTWEEREPPLRALDDHALRARLDSADRRMSAAFDELLRDDADAVIPDVGFGFPVTELVTHMRQEYAVHRWDLAGDDDTGNDLLAQPVLISHAVRMLGGALLATGLQRDPSDGEPLIVHLRCDGEPDVVLDVRAGGASLELAEPDETATDVVHADAAARLLLLWGRRTADPRRVSSGMAPRQLARMRTILSGF